MPCPGIILHRRFHDRYVTFTVFCIKPSCAIYFGVVNVRLKKEQAADAAAMAAFGSRLLDFVHAKCDDIFCMVVGDFAQTKGGSKLYVTVAPICT